MHNDNNLVQITAKDIAPEGLYERIDDVVEKMLAMPQSEIPVIHRFAPGLYIREVHMPAGSFIVGHEHKTEHFNVMLQGHLIMVNEDGSKTDYIAPQSYTAKPGRKVAYIVDDVVWQNIFPTDETDIDKLDELLLNKSERVQLNEKMQAATAYIGHEADRFDYYYMLDKNKLTEDVVRSMSENEEDQVPMPCQVHPYRISKSPIEGTGYFLTVKAKAGSILAPARVDNKRTPAGRYVNHSGTPNAQMQFAPDGNLYLVAIKDIDGCLGGNIGTEITTDYGQTLALLNIDGEKLCQKL